MLDAYRSRWRVACVLLTALIVLGSIDGVLKTEAARLLRLRGVAHSLASRSAYDENGNRTQDIITGTAVTNQTDTASFDEINQLSTVTYGSGSSVSYTYDENGNRLSQTSGLATTNYTCNDADQLTATTGAFASTSAHGDSGNRTSVTSASGADTFDYDWNNRLIAATVGGGTVDYAYAGDDLRISRTEASATDSYLWDRLTVLPTMVSDGTTESIDGPVG